MRLRFVPLPFPYQAEIKASYTQPLFAVKTCGLAPDNRTVPLAHNHVRRGSFHPMTMLDGIRIIDLTSVIFGPYATQMLADMGADVIKVEPPQGDISRYLGRPRAGNPTMGSTHMTVNRGKRSLMLDLKKPKDAEHLRSLIPTADVFFHNIRADAIERLGFGYEAVKAQRSDIIYVHGTGFGQHGPYADLQAYDDVIQSATGTTGLLPRADGNPRPRYLPSLIADKVAGHYGAQAILAALVHKLRTGDGQHVEVPMFECFTNFMLEEHLRDATFVPPIGPIGYPRQIDPGRQPFPTADGYISIVPYTDPKVHQLMQLLGGHHFLDEERFATPLARYQNSTALYTEIAKLTPAKTTAEWMKIFEDGDMPAMPDRDLADIFDDPHLKATGFFRPRTHPTEGEYLEMTPPIRFSADKDRTLGVAPGLGEHNAALLGKIS
jgi:crotonobetainyl-CoA:carnitine CoA-transferase CaiB-like acyl-CoA transferase